MGSIPIPGSSTESLYQNDIINFLWYLKKQGYKNTTIEESYSKVLKNIAKNCNLNDPKAVNDFVARKHVSSGRKELIVNCYMNYCNYKGHSFNIPRYKRVDKIPYVPLEKDIEALIASLPRKLSIFTRVAKETGARPGEIGALNWEDIDFSRNVIRINYPEKGSRARTIRVSGQTIPVLTKLPRNNKFVLRSHPKAKLKNLLSYFIRKKKQISAKLCNPQVKKITWKSLQHFKGTMEYHRTKDILYVKEILGHR